MNKFFATILFFVAFCSSVVCAQGNFSSTELDTLVSSIALYPDPLLENVLNASMYEDDIHNAAVWANAHSHLQGDALHQAIDNANLNFESSVLALLSFPSVLSMMDKYSSWCRQLGAAVFYQKTEVDYAIQRMRGAAHAHGHLKSNEQVKVVVDDRIVITPVRTEYIYVPVYNPRVVYSVYADGYIGITYSAPIFWPTYRIHHYRAFHRPPPAPRHHRHRHTAPPPPRHHARPAPAPAPRVAPRPAPAPVQKVSAAPRAQALPAPRVAPPKQEPVRVYPAQNQQEDYQNSSRSTGKATAVSSSRRNEAPPPRQNTTSRNNDNRNNGRSFGRSMKR